MTEHDSNPPILDVNRLLAATQKEFHKRGLYAEKRPDFTGFIRNNSSETLVYYIVHNRGTPEEKQEPRSIEPGAYAKLAPVMNKVREIVAWEFNVQKVKNRFPQEAFEAYNDPRTIVSTHAEAVALAKERQGSAVIINEASYEKAIADLLEWNKGISPERIQTGFVASRNHSYFLRMPIDAQIHQDWGLQSAKAGYMLQMTVDGKGRPLGIYTNDNTLFQFINPKTGASIANSRWKIPFVNRHSLLSAAEDGIKSSWLTVKVSKLIEALKRPALG